MCSLRRPQKETELEAPTRGKPNTTPIMIYSVLFSVIMEQLFHAPILLHLLQDLGQMSLELAQSQSD